MDLHTIRRKVTESDLVSANTVIKRIPLHYCLILQQGDFVLQRDVTIRLLIDASEFVYIRIKHLACQESKMD